MNIYHITTTLPSSYDCADEFVVQALDMIEAKHMTLGQWGDHSNKPGMISTLRAKKLGVVTAELPQAQKIIVRSFNAG